MPENVNFDLLYRSHYRRVVGLCRQLLGRSGGQAEDAAQEVFMRAYRALDRYDPAQPFSGWILRIASNHCIDIMRRRKKETRLFGDEDVETLEVESGDASALGALLSAEQADEMKAAVASLPEKYRIPLVLAYYEESSYDEIASTLGITRNHVGVLILRAKQALRQRLAREGTVAEQAPPPGAKGDRA